MKPIIKNKNKYKLIKIPKGIELDECKTVPRDDGTGVSTEKFGKNWFVTPQGKALFKNYDIKNAGMRIVNELIYDELAKQIDLPVAKYVPAEFKTHSFQYFLQGEENKIRIQKREFEETNIGLASIDVRKAGEKIFTGTELLDFNSFYGEETFVDYMMALDIFKDKKGFAVDINDIETKLFKMMLLDSLTFMEDRNCFNVSFIKNDKKQYLKFSPVIDNEMAFAGKNLWFNYLFMNNKNDFNDIDLRNFLTKHGSEMRMFVNSITRISPPEKRYQKNVKAIVELGNENLNYKKILNSALKNLDIDKAIQNVEKLGYEISTEYKDYVKNLMHISRVMYYEFIRYNNKKKNCLVEKNNQKNNKVNIKKDEKII